MEFLAPIFAAAGALAAGVPVVTTDVGDIRELVKDGKNGYLVPVGDIDRAANAVEKLLSNERLLLSMSENARITAAAYLAQSTLESAVEEWRKVFIELRIIG